MLWKNQQFCHKISLQSSNKIFGLYFIKLPTFSDIKSKKRNDQTTTEKKYLSHWLVFATTILFVIDEKKKQNLSVNSLHILMNN